MTLYCFKAEGPLLLQTIAGGGLASHVCASLWLDAIDNPLCACARTTMCIEYICLFVCRCVCLFVSTVCWSVFSSIKYTCTGEYVKRR